RQSKGNPLKKGFRWYIWAAGIAVVCLGVILLIVLTPFTPKSVVQTDDLKCLIVDHLYNLQSNPGFIDQVTEEFEKIGFTVDVYRGDEITVDFYRQLPSHGYKVVLFRVHAGLLENETGMGDKIWLFTNESYSRMRYYMMQLRDQVAAAAVRVDGEPVFAISSKFITDIMRYNFNNTVIINMGCATFYNDDLAEAFIEREASTYLGWDVSVGLTYVEEATMTLVEKLCTEEMTISQAVTSTMEEIGPDPNNNAFLHYSPPENADKTLRQIVE
ncbi:MAG: hypothetical protein JSU79_06905, partial [Dehalococcoidales bacterium]